jgi:hypothetical protein
MNFVDRQDRFLLAGLVIAVVVVFSGPIRYLLDLARDVERPSGLALIPALLILIFVFFIHQQGKRQEAKAHALAAEADAETAQARAAELERLVHFGEALGRSLDLESIRDAAAQHLPKLAESDEPSACAPAATGRRSPRARDFRRQRSRAREQIANRAPVGGRRRADDAGVDGQLCFC